MAIDRFTTSQLSMLFTDNVIIIDSYYSIGHLMGILCQITSINSHMKSMVSCEIPMWYLFFHRIMSILLPLKKTW